MSTKEKDKDLFEDEEHYEWHGLPAMIGGAINEGDYGTHSWGGYLVRQLDNGAISIYRRVDQAQTRDGLDDEGDYVADFCDWVEAGEEIGYISPPEDGWESETSHLPESIFDGYE